MKNNTVPRLGDISIALINHTTTEILEIICKSSSIRRLHGSLNRKQSALIVVVDSIVKLKKIAETKLARDRQFDVAFIENHYNSMSSYAD